MLYEQRKHDGTLPLVGVNTFLALAAEGHGEAEPARLLALARSTEEEKQACLRRLREFQAEHAPERPAALERLRRAAGRRQPVRGAHGRGVRVCSLGEITSAVRSRRRYRRNVRTGSGPAPHGPTPTA